MKHPVLSLVAASALLGGALAVGPVAAWPAASTVTRSTALQARATRAPAAYVDAGVDGDRQALAATLADGAALELPLGEPGSLFLADAGNAANFCEGSGASGHVTSLTTFPAGGDVLFASFRQDGDEPLGDDRK